MTTEFHGMGGRELAIRIEQLEAALRNMAAANRRLQREVNRLGGDADAVIFAPEGGAEKKEG